MAHPTGITSSNPFDHAFEMLGHMPEVTTENVNAEALELLTQALTSRAGERGRMVLLRSPRAGFGKTHLLMRLHQRVAHTHEFIPLEPSKGRYLDAQSVLDAVLRRFSRVLPAGGGLTVLDLLARRILAAGLEPLVKSGEVPSQDRESALQALQMRPVETFDFHNEEAVTARWAMANFSLLGPRLTAELAERTQAGYRPVAWWVELLFRYSSAPIDQASRNSSLFETVFGSESVETDMHEKLVTLLNLTGLVTSPVLILDEVEGFSSNPEAALQVATFLNALHQSCNKLALIISVNGDVWETAFLPRIPCGLKDRLSDIVIDLKPMDKETAVTLLKDRAGDSAYAIADTMDFDTGVIYARGLIREASVAWNDVAVDQVASAQADDSNEMLDPISLLTPESEVEPISPEPTAPYNEPDPERELHAPAAVVIPGEVSNPEPFTSEPSTDDLQTPEPSQSIFSVETATDEPPVTQAPVFEPAAVETAAVIEPEPRPELPADLPQPFAHLEQPREPAEFGGNVAAAGAESASPFSIATDEPSNTGHEPAPFTSAPEPISPSTVTVAPQNVIESPFSIDSGSAEATAPFQPVQPAQAQQPTQPVQPAMTNPTAAEGAPSPIDPTTSMVSDPSPQVPVEESPFRVDDGKAATHAVTDNDHDKVEDLLKQFRDRYGRD